LAKNHHKPDCDNRIIHKYHNKDVKTQQTDQQTALTRIKS